MRYSSINHQIMFFQSLMIYINMLYSFHRYSTITRLNTLLCINSESNLRNSIGSFQYRAKRIYPSIFFRKSYFRSLLLHLGVLYSTISDSVDSNYFYSFNFVIINYSNNHPNFYFRKIRIT